MLPYTSVADIKNQAGETLDTGVPVRIEEVGNLTTRTGQAYNWVGEAHIDAAEFLVDRVNIRIETDGRKLKIVDAIEHDFLPHVELRLTEMRGG